MRYAKIRKMDITNGEGIGVSLFVQGCHFHCEGCFNSETWDFNGGKEWNKEVKQQFLDLIKRPYIKRVSILGGEPLCDENVEDVYSLLQEIKVLFPNVQIWLYTGYSLDDILHKSKENTYQNRFWIYRFHCALLANVIVDGKFEIDKQDLYNEHIVWAGSTNQHVYHMPESYLEEVKKWTN